MGIYNDWEEYRTGFLMKAYSKTFNDCYNEFFSRMDKAIDQEQKVFNYFYELVDHKQKLDLLQGWKDYISDKKYALLKSFTEDGYSGDYDLYLQYTESLKNLEDKLASFLSTLN